MYIYVREGGGREERRETETDRETGDIHAIVGMLRSEDNLWKSVLSFHSMRFRNQTLVIRLDSRHFGPMNQIADPQFHIQIVIFLAHKLQVFLKIRTVQVDIVHFL